MKTSTAVAAVAALLFSPAIAHLALFEAVNAVTGDYKPYLGTITASPGASAEAAAVVAAQRRDPRHRSGKVAREDPGRTAKNSGHNSR